MHRDFTKDLVKRLLDRSFHLDSVGDRFSFPYHFIFWYSEIWKKNGHNWLNLIQLIMYLFRTNLNVRTIYTYNIIKYDIIHVSLISNTSLIIKDCWFIIRPINISPRLQHKSSLVRRKSIVCFRLFQETFLKEFPDMNDRGT